MSAADWSVIFYFGSIFFLMILAVLFPYFDRVFAVFIASILFFFSGFREGGFDYDAYLVMIQSGLESHNASLIDAASYAKDPLFGVFTYGVSFFSSDEVFIFGVMVFFAVFTKLLFAFSMSGRSSSFLGLYAIFLAPGLEFAAVRTALGLGLFLLAIQRWSTRKYKNIFLVLAGLSHISVWVPVVAAYFQRKVSKRLNVLALLGVVVVSFLTAESVRIWAPTRAEDYVGDLGTLNAVIVALFCLFLVIFSFPKRALASSQVESSFSNVALYNVSLVLMTIAVGAASPQVTLSSRILEISWCITFVLFFRVGWFKRNIAQFWIGLFVFLAFLCFENIYRETWVAFYEFNIF